MVLYRILACFHTHKEIVMKGTLHVCSVSQNIDTLKAVSVLHNLGV